MRMRYSQLFGKSTRSVSQDVRSRGHEFLIRGGYIRESGAGRFYQLPLGLRVQERVCIARNIDRFFVSS